MVFINWPSDKDDYNIETDVSDFSAGKYIVSLLTNEGVQMAKDIKLVH